MIESKHNIDTGKLIGELLSRLKLKNVEIEKAIGRKGSSINKYIKNSSIQTSILIDLCYATKHNIFQDIANELPSEFTKTDKEAGDKLAFKLSNEKRIADLEEENKILKVQLDMVMKLKGENK